MKVFKLTVSTPTRKGSLPHYERVFTSEASQGDLYNKFALDYKGFQVTVAEVENVEVVEAQARLLSGQPKTFWEAPFIEVRLTPEELVKVLKIQALSQEAEDLEKEVSAEILTRIAEKSWISPNQRNASPQVRKLARSPDTIRIDNVRLNWAVVTGQGEGPVYD